MKQKRRYITLFLFVTYLALSYLAFWKQIDWAFMLQLYLPIAILLSVALFGTNLLNKFEVTIRVVSIIFLVIGLGLAYNFICCSGEQGGVGVMFLGAPILFLTFLVYLILWLIQKFKKT